MRVWFRHRLLPWIHAALGCVALASVSSHAEDVVPRLREPWWERQQKPLHPKIEKALADFTEKIVPLRRKDLSGHMRKEIDTLVSTTGLDDEAKKQALTEAAERAVDEAMKPFAKAVTETNRVRLFPEPVDAEPMTEDEVMAAVSSISRWAVEGIAVNRLVLGCTLPEEQPLWRAAVKEQLTPEQYSKWDKATAERLDGKKKEIEELLAPWVKSATESAQKVMKERIDEMAGALKLDDARTAQLREASEATIQRICADEKAHAAEALQFVPDERRGINIQRNRVFTGFPLNADPQDDRQWRDALRKILSPAERLAFEKQQKAERDKLNAEIAEFLKPSLAAFMDEARFVMEGAASRIATAAGLPEDRSKAFEPASKAALARAEKAWMEAALKGFGQASMAEARKALDGFKERKQRYYVSLRNGKYLQDDPAWNEQALGLLTPEEKKRYEESLAARKQRRVTAIAQVMLVEMDQRVAFTASQRIKLLPLAERAVTGQQGLFPKENEDVRYGRDYELPLFLAAAKSLKDDELRVILDDLQLKNWKAACSNPEAANNSRMRQIVPQAGTAKPDPKAPARKPEPEDVERAISDYLYEKTSGERNKMLTAMLLQVEDAGRVASLSPANITRLQTAARGATESLIDSMKSSWDRNIRDYTRGATPQNIAQRLQGVNDYFYYSRPDKGVEANPIWKATLNAEMTEAQRAAWKKEVDERKAYRERAIAAIVLAELDRIIMLSAAQWEGLAPQLQKAIGEYGQDIDNYFSGGGSPWYLQNYSLLIPVAAIPEEEMKKLLRKDQGDLWRQASANAMNYWPGIKENHDSRVRR